jgi:cytochrome b561
MAKARKNYSKNSIAWHWVLFYVLIGAIIFSLLYYSGILKFGEVNNSETREVEYYQ